MGRKKSELGTFHKAATAAGMTYAEAQMQETIRDLKKVKVPKGKIDGTAYSKVPIGNITNIWKDE